MKQYQLFIRTHTDEWVLAGTFPSANIAWEGMMLARSRGCPCRVTLTRPSAQPAEEAHG